MPDNWIGHIKLTSETEVLDAKGEKIHGLIPCDQGADVEVDKALYPVLWDKLGGLDEDPYWSDVVFLNKMEQWSGNTINGEVGGDLTSSYLVQEVGKFGSAVSAGTHVAFSSSVSIFGAGIASTFDCWLKITNNKAGGTLGGTTMLVGHMTGNYTGWNTHNFAIICESGNMRNIRFRFNNGTVEFPYTLQNLNEWYYISVSKDELDNYYIHVNGTMIHTFNDSSIQAISQVMRLGSINMFPQWVHLDDYRVTYGSARYGSEDYTVPTASAGVNRGGILPNMTAPTGSPHPYKIIADKT